RSESFDSVERPVSRLEPMSDEQREPTLRAEPQPEAQAKTEQDEERPVLDPEAREKRRRALTLIRTFGDPSLRSKALEVTRFDEPLAEELRRRGQPLDDATGSVPAATPGGGMDGGGGVCGRIVRKHKAQ